VRVGQAERLPFDEGTFDVVLAQLVVNFMSDPQADRIEGHETRVVVRGPSADTFARTGTQERTSKPAQSELKALAVKATV